MPLRNPPPIARLLMQADEWGTREIYQPCVFMAEARRAPARSTGSPDKYAIEMLVPSLRLCAVYAAQTPFLEVSASVISRRLNFDEVTQASLVNKKPCRIATKGLLASSEFRGLVYGGLGRSRNTGTGIIKIVQRLT